MPSLSEVNAAQRALRDLTTLAAAEFLDSWGDLSGLPPRRLVQLLRELVAELTLDYGPVAATDAAEWYEEARAESVGGRFSASLDLPDVDELQEHVSWAAAPLFVDEPNPEQVRLRSLGVLQKAVAMPHRGTIITNMRRDPLDVRYARHASASACNFCKTLTVRQAVYRSEASATNVVGRGTAKRGDGSRMDARRKGIRARGSQQLGDPFHKNCHCIAVPVWPGDRVEEAPYVSDWRDEYYAATDKVGSRDLTAITSQMRRAANA